MPDHDEEFEPWTLSDLTGHLRRQDPDTDGRVVREVTRRMAEQLPKVTKLDPGLLALDLSHALAEIAVVADILVHEWMFDLDDEEMPEGAALLVSRLQTCAEGFKEISGSF